MASSHSYAWLFNPADDDERFHLSLFLIGMGAYLACNTLWTILLMWWAYIMMAPGGYCILMQSCLWFLLVIISFVSFPLQVAAWLIIAAARLFCIGCGVDVDWATPGRSKKMRVALFVWRQLVGFPKELFRRGDAEWRRDY